MDFVGDFTNSLSGGVSVATDFAEKTFPWGLKGLLALFAAGLLSTKFLWKKHKTGLTKQKIKNRQAKVKKSIDDIRKRIESYGKAVDKTITELPFEELQSKLQKGDLTCKQVIQAYQAKALELNDTLNFATGFIADAEERADQLDQLSPSERGTLHGIPLSLKEVLGVKGEDATGGLSFFIDKLYDDYNVSTKILINQGAIPFLRTNISQGQVGISCSNPIFGESKNPVKVDRSPGGSSGGEGCAIGGGASIVGLGCDMGGSIRIPSHLCGTCGFKPTQDRLSDIGNIPTGHGMGTVDEVVGPMARDVQGLVALMKGMLVPELYSLDPLLPNMPWREELYTSTKPMKIGYYLSDGVIAPSPAVSRGVLMAKDALEKMGHQVVEFKPSGVLEAFRDLFIATAVSDGGNLLGSVMDHEVIDPSIYSAVVGTQVPYFLRCVLAKLLFFFHPVERNMLTAKPCKTVWEFWELSVKVHDFRHKFTTDLKSKGLDGLICPTLPMASWPIRNEMHAIGGTTYTGLYNLLNMPAGVVPVTKVNARDVENMKTYPKNNATDKYMHEIAKDSEGLPVGVQCVSLNFMEEVALRIMRDVQTGLK